MVYNFLEVYEMYWINLITFNCSTDNNINMALLFVISLYSLWSYIDEILTIKFSKAKILIYIKIFLMNSTFTSYLWQILMGKKTIPFFSYFVSLRCDSLNLFLLIEVEVTKNIIFKMSTETD